MAAYAGPWRLVSAQPIPPALVALARKLVGGMLDTGVPKRTWRLDDGSQIHALLVNGVPKVTITQPAPAAKREQNPTDLWIPRGFVVYPATHAAPYGYGLPIVQDSSAGPYDRANLEPGLDTARWTAGGPCGEVLVSPDDYAGYPESRLSIPSPLLFHPTLGPGFHWSGKGFYDERTPQGAWTSYRMALAAPVANYADEDIGASLSLFEQINTYRTGAGATELALLPRGYYRPAKVMASIMLANGSTDETSSSYPLTYRTSADRLTKDGYSATVMDVTFDTFDRGDHPTSFELRHLGGSAADVLAVWQGDADSDAVLTKDVGPAAFADVGNRAGYWAVNITERTRWIEAGNVSWQSADAALPPISWHGFASVNLAWETYPASYDVENYETAPLVPLRSFTDGQGDCWLSYPRNTAPKAADLEPALSRHVYCRGRAIALAPRGGLVWGACVATVVTDTGAVDRLVVLVHHPEEQPTDYTSEGFTRYLRVWWCDVPRRATLRLDPQQTICGEDPDDTWSWRGGQQLDLGDMPAPATGFTASPGVTSLKYASAWRFAPDGSRAICLRDYGAFVDYAVLGAQNTLWSAALNPRAVEVVFDHAADGTTAHMVFHDYTAGLVGTDRLLSPSTPPGTDEVFNIALYERGAVPIAVDYSLGGQVVYAFAASVGANQPSIYTDPAGTGSFSDHCSFAYLGTGDASAAYATDLGQRVLHGAVHQTPSIDASDELAVVLDVVSGAFAAKVTRPRYRVDPADALTLYAITRPCQQYTDEPVNGVRLFRHGAMLSEDWYPCPDGAIYTLRDRCFTSSTDAGALLVFLPLAASANVQGYYGQRLGQVLLSYQCAPVPGAALALSIAPDDAACGCQLTNAALADAHWLLATELNPRGGRAASSVPLPDGDWLIYSKVV